MKASGENRVQLSGVCMTQGSIELLGWRFRVLSVGLLGC